MARGVYDISRRCECEWELLIAPDRRPDGWALVRPSTACPLPQHQRLARAGWPL